MLSGGLPVSRIAMRIAPVLVEQLGHPVFVGDAADGFAHERRDRDLAHRLALFDVVQGSMESVITSSQHRLGHQLIASPDSNAVRHIRPRLPGALVDQGLARGKFAILETGKPPGELEARFGGYPQMFETLLADGGRRFQTYNVTQGDYPSPGIFDASADHRLARRRLRPLPWIAPLRHSWKPAPSRRWSDCFGHQIMAQAFGGRVEKSDKGFGIGLHPTRSRRPNPGWTMSRLLDPRLAPGSGGAAPPAAASSPASGLHPIAALAYDSIPAILVPGHPEFDPAFASALIENRRRTRFNDPRPMPDWRACGRRRPVEGRRWITRFLDGTGARLGF